MPRPTLLLKALTLLTALTTLASARITGITLPATVGAGTTFTATITTQNYIQSVQDVAIAFGIAPVAYAIPGELGLSVVGERMIGPALSNTLANISVPITLPASTQQGEAVVAAALYSLYGARYGPTITNYNVTVMVANATDCSRTVSSWGSY